MEGSPGCQFEIVLSENIFLRRTYLTYANQMVPKTFSIEWCGLAFCYYAAFTSDE